MTYIYPIASVLIVSLVSLLGVFTLSLREQTVKKYVFLLVSLAVGALIGDAFIHLIPESFEEISNPLYVSLAIIAGILGFFVLEKVLHWHHHHDEQDESADHIHPSGKIILLSDGVHNFIDGLIIGASFFISPEVGIATTIAIILHEIPQEIGDFGVLIHSGYTAKRALFLNFVSAIVAVIGAVTAILIGEASEALAMWLVPVAAGGFIYIALTDLIPEIHKTKKLSASMAQFVAILIGISAMLLLLTLE